MKIICLRSLSLLTLTASNKLRKMGDGSTPGSCSNCDPTKAECPVGCQDLIDTLYWSCADVDIPDGYYFDPKYTLDGAWNSIVTTMKINVERCGCNAAFKQATLSLATIAAATIVSLYLAW